MVTPLTWTFGVRATRFSRYVRSAEPVTVTRYRMLANGWTSNSVPYDAGPARRLARMPPLFITATAPLPTTRIASAMRLPSAY